MSPNRARSTTSSCSSAMVFGLLFYVGIGLLARLMPQLQVFFIALPLQIGLMLMLLGLTVSAMMIWFLNGFEDFLGGIVAPPKTAG